jgi:hypothetical protein
MTPKLLSKEEYDYERSNIISRKDPVSYIAARKLIDHCDSQSQRIAELESTPQVSQPCREFVWKPMSERIAKLEQENRRMREALKLANRRLWEHHDVTYGEKVEAGHKCYVCIADNVNVFEVIHAALNAGKEEEPTP